MTYCAKVSDNLYRGSRPTTCRDFEALRDKGVTRIVDLESGFIEMLTSSQNLQQWLAYLYGMEIVRVKMNAILPPSKEDVDLAVKYLGVPGETTFVHCREGRDRTGYVVAVFRMTECGWSWERARHEMMLHGFHWYYWYWLRSLSRWKTT